MYMATLKIGPLPILTCGWSSRIELFGNGSAITSIGKYPLAGCWREDCLKVLLTGLRAKKRKVAKERTLILQASFDSSTATGVVKTNRFKINLDEYMVKLDKPIGIRFAQTLSGKIYVEALAKDGNAEESMMIMVGDVLKKTSALFGETMWDVEDFGRSMHAIKTCSGPVSLVFERSAPPMHSDMKSKKDVPFNSGKVAFATWNGNILASPLRGGSVGFLTYSSKYLLPKGLTRLVDSTSVKEYAAISGGKALGDFEAEDQFEVIAEANDQDSDDEIEWARDSYNNEAYEAALARLQNDFTYNPTQGITYSKMTENIYVGSCIQSETDVLHLTETLDGWIRKGPLCRFSSSSYFVESGPRRRSWCLRDGHKGITAVLNLQHTSEQVNWGIDGQAIQNMAQGQGLQIVNCPVRDVDTVDLRRKLPYAVGVLHRLLRRCHRVYVTCTTGLDRSPSCIIAYLHWIQDVSLARAYEFVTSVHPSGPDRPALVWSTWDLIAMAEKSKHDGPPTHAVQLVWNHGCHPGVEVLVVGEFTSDWTKPIKANHVSGTNYTVNLRLPQGKYFYKFIVGGHWRHSNNLPTDVDSWGNINNVLQIGDVASTKFHAPVRPYLKDPTTIKVIERPLSEDERFTLAFAARRIAFSISPVTFMAKR